MPSEKQLLQPVQVIRLGLIAGVLLFGAVIQVLHGQPGWKPTTLPAAVGYAQVGYAVVAVFIAISLRGRVAREPEAPRRLALLITGWALGEAAALFGAVIFFLTGQTQYYLLGLLAMAASFVMLRTDTTA